MNKYYKRIAANALTKASIPGFYVSVICDGKIATLGMGTTCGSGDNTWGIDAVYDLYFGFKYATNIPKYVLDGFTCGTPSEPVKNL